MLIPHGTFSYTYMSHAMHMCDVIFTNERRNIYYFLSQPGTMTGKIIFSSSDKILYNNPI